MLRKTSPYIALIIAAFAVMGVVSYFSAHNVFTAQTEENINHIFDITETNIAHGLTMAEVEVLSICNYLGVLLDRGSDSQRLTDYLRGTSTWMHREENGAPGFLGVYGYLNGDFVDGVGGFDPGPEHPPESRPWFRAGAGLKEGEFAVTAPYVDMITGKPVITMVRSMYGETGAYYGVLAMDVDLAWFSEHYAHGMNLRGYGMVLDEDFVIVCHPDPALLGKKLDELSFEYATAANSFRLNGRLWNDRITDINGAASTAFSRLLENGWYAVQIMPLEEYYSSLYALEINPAFMGLIMILLFSLLMLRINAAQIRADEISAYKSAFLAQMSHEVRTPMNTVLGMSELALRESDPVRMVDYVAGIKRAANSLLAIINDILDISRIESGNLKITPVSYYFSSLLNDVLSMIRVQLADKPVVFTSFVAPGIPNALVGDETRIKQILLNLLSNAVKYTREGFVSLDIRGKLVPDDTVLLTIKITDSGVGIRREDMAALFENFVRLDPEGNRGVEGAGLGLVITRNLCQAMGGDITIQSEYGSGSVFTATVLQKFEEETALASVEAPQDKRVICFTEEQRYAASLLENLESLGVPAKHSAVREEFFRELDRGGYRYAFVTADLVEETVDRIKTGFLPTHPVFLANPGEMVSFHHIPMLTMPGWVVSIANVLNHRTIYDQRGQRPVSFIIPDARVLIVDDIATNIKVAEGLLSLYQPAIDTCDDGPGAVELVRKHHYDVIFLDHMMPGMDGIETASAIRSLKGPRFQALPIVALTANAIFGMREMFLQNGFNDYLAKPIEIHKLEEVLLKWIPKEKQVPVSGMENTPETAPRPVSSGASTGGGTKKSGLIFDIPPPDTEGSTPIDGIDIEAGMTLTASFTWTMYSDVLALYCEDVMNRLPNLLLPDGETIREFCVQLHALKGASASIGAEGLARQAAELEAAGKNGDMAEVEKRLGSFRREMEALVARIQAALPKKAAAS
ncbi:MAG: response regulator [Spirochaetaceae bacterium]|nr:response regulator [Spirochaetaceae bacterium]